MTFIQDLEQAHALHFNQQQIDAIQHTQGPALILAVPGAGKTTTLICRTGFLIFEEKITPHSILSLTFSRAAALDMKKRFNELFQSHLHANISFSTFHSFCYRFLKAFDRELPAWTLLEGKGAPISKKKLIAQIHFSMHREWPNEEVIEEILRQISVAKNRETTVATSSMVKALPEIAAQYESEKEKNRWFDYDDLLRHTLNRLRKDSTLRQQLQKRYPYIQVDESQDLSPVQFQLISCLLSSKKNIFMVADDDQSIYGFRGAMPEELFAFTKNEANFSVYRMETNYRSGTPLIEAANAVIQKNTSRFDKHMIKREDVSTSLHLHICSNPEDQLKQIESKVQEKQDQGSIGILFRNRISALPILNVMESQHIQVNVRDLQTNFFRSALYKDFRAFFLFSLDPSDGESLDQIWYKFNGYIKKRDYQQLRSLQSDENLLRRLIQTTDLPLYQRRNIQRIEDCFHQVQKQRPSFAIETILRDLNYRDHLNSKKDKANYRGEVDSQHLSILQTLATQSVSIIDFLSRCDQLQARLSRFEKPQSSITLSTLHGAKGLEFDHVLMIDLIDGILPSAIAKKQDSFGDIALLEEERRLFYVGMTRAKKSCSFFSYTRLDQAPCTPTPYLTELQPFLSSLPADEWQPGSLVTHKTLGQGSIQQLDYKFIWIDFPKQGIKKFARAFVARHNLLKKSDDSK
ncbi:ATP-dependent helicase [Gottschalkiaceae bacterium SANA]|nr:ATP-dependent helicase [Gottschalkiaceae bacterium SANA]